MMRPTSLNILWAIKSEFYDKVTALMIDLKDAFQSTATVDADGELKTGEREFYTNQAPPASRSTARMVKSLCAGRSATCKVASTQPLASTSAS